MAINRAMTSTAEQLNLEINNGDFEALRNTAQRLNFKDEESMLRFMLAILSKSATRSITIINQDGSQSTLNPSNDLLKEPLKS